MNSAGGHTCYYVYMIMDDAAGFDLRILWYLLCFDIRSSLVSSKVLEKCEL